MPEAPTAAADRSPFPMRDVRSWRAPSSDRVACGSAASSRRTSRPSAKCPSPHRMSPAPHRPCVRRPDSRQTDLPAFRSRRPACRSRQSARNSRKSSPDPPWDRRDGPIPNPTPAHAVRADDQIAEPEIAMHQRHLRRPPGIMVAQPAEGEFEDGLRPVEAAIFARELADLLARGALAQLRQPFTRKPVNTGCDPAKLTRELRAGVGELRITQNLARDGLAFDALHDEAGAEIVIGLKQMQDARRRQTGRVSELHQRRLGIESRRAQGRRTISLRRATQDGADIAGSGHDLKRPGLLTGSAGQLDCPRNAGRARIPGDHRTRELILDHCPVNFAGRFSRKAVTPSRKSSELPAMRCDWYSRSSWSSKEFSGLSQ